MKLCIEGHDYKYASEQIVMAMFPKDKPIYVSKGELSGGGVLIKLCRGKVYSTVSAAVYGGGSVYRAASRVKNADFTDKLQENRLISGAIKSAVYKAAIKSGAEKTPWGCLTGVRPCKLIERFTGEGMDISQAAKRLCREYFVSMEKALLCADASRAAESVRKTLQNNSACLYIGIPFCPTRCAYCSFVSKSTEFSSDLVPPFLDALKREIDAAASEIEKSGLEIVSVYFGGGTPTTLSAESLDDLISYLKAKIHIKDSTEFTVEAGRPDTITEEKLAVLKKHGVNRISVNPQTMSDEVLRAIGRRHTAQDILSAYEIAGDSGIENINMDLIAGLPKDDLRGFKRTLDAVIELSPENITVHTLALKKGSDILLNKTALPSGEEVGEMLQYAKQRLYNSGYKPYYLYRQKYMSGGFENVGWAKCGTESLYNILIMEEMCSIIALGGGASSKLVDMKTGKIERIFNPKYPKEYIENIDTVRDKKKYISQFYNKERK